MKVKTTTRMIPGTGEIHKTRWRKSPDGIWHLEGTDHSVVRRMKAQVAVVRGGFHAFANLKHAMTYCETAGK